MLVLLLLAISVCIGTLLQKCKSLRHLEHTSTWTVWLLILVFGISLGSNETIVNDFAHYGFTALVISLAGVLGSVLAAFAIRNYIDKSDPK